ncbi:hypothetical protein F4823DRAFT_557547 [Ustulina deusta]|nr:hypothetical protein F4823DRAFT_557547 [Ustulina deusta]
MEVAGLVLGALPIAISAVESYLKGLQAIDHYKNYPQTLRGIRRNIFIQQWKGIATIAWLCPKWTDETPERVSWEWRRVKRSFGEKERKELFDELQGLNTALKNCLEPKREILSDRADPVTMELVRRFDLKSCDKARENVQIVYEALAEAWSNCTDHQHPSNVELIWQQTGLKETGQLQLSVPELGGNGKDKHWQKIFISIDPKRIDSRAGCNAAPNLLPTTMLAPGSTSVVPIKRKLPPTSRLRRLLDPNSKPSELAVVSQKQVASLPLESLRSSQKGPPDSQLITELCSLIRQKDWNGHLLHTDTANEKVIYMKRVLSPCCSFSSLALDTVISDSYYGSSKGKQVTNVRLSRKERLGVAAAAVWAVLILCGTPWLEERWLGKEDINLLVEVPAQANSFDRPKTYPSLSHIFMSQRETSSKLPGSHSSNDYQEYQIRHKTLFALGILLIELGLNKTFHQIRADTSTGGPIRETSVQDDYAIAKQVIDSEELELELGESYANAVQRCIQCHFLGSESTQNFLHSKFRKQFFTGVVAPVQATFDAQITSVQSL